MISLPSSHLSAKDLGTQLFVFQIFEKKIAYAEALVSAEVAADSHSLTCKDIIAIYSPIFDLMEIWLKNFSHLRFSPDPQPNALGNFRSLMGRVQSLVMDSRTNAPKSNGFKPLLNEKIRECLNNWTISTMQIVDAKWIQEKDLDSRK